MPPGTYVKQPETKRTPSTICTAEPKPVCVPLVNAEFVDAIASAGLIYFSGGDPHRIADVFKDSPMWAAIVTAWESGSSLAGCSAGAMAFGGTIMGIRRSHHSAGLGIVPGIEVIPHYDKMLGWLPERVTAFVLRPDATTALIGIDENTALVYTDKWQS